MKTISRYIMTLALLLTAVTGAWATDPNTVIWNGNGATWNGWTESVTTHTVGDITITCSGNAKAYENIMASGHPLSMEAGDDDAITFTSNGAPFTSIKIKMYDGTDPGLVGWTWDNGYNIEWSGTPSTSVTLNGCNIKVDMITFTFGTAEAPITVEPVTGKTNEWTFTMPAFDVEIDPIYAPVAQWAKVENVDQLPTAIEGIYAESTDAIVTAGTVAKIGETENVQGTLMYAVGTSATEQPALTAFSATLPTAEKIAAGDVYVWYYIKGADTPQGQTATAENTFNDSEICTTPLKVTVLNNKFDIQFKAANANTIEAGKATVTVGGTAATVTEGKLEGVKMGSEVKIKANTGYKFRKVEAKKKELPKYADVVTICKKNGDNKYLISSFFDGTNANITTITKEEAIALAEYLGGGNIFVVYEEYEISSYRYVRTTNAAGNVTSAWLSTTNTFNDPVYYVPAGN